MKIWHPFSDWEDLGMWRDIDKPEYDRLLPMAAEFTGDDKLYGEFMRKALLAFPKACEHNLTCQSMNKRAWIGRAACYLAIGCPEYVTRHAWAMLTEEQRILADKQADEAIDLWSKNFERENTGLDKEMGGQGLLWRHP